MSLFSIITDAIKASNSSQEDKFTNLNTTQNLRITTTFFNGEQTNAQQTAQPLTINTKEQNEEAIKALGQQVAQGQQTQQPQESHFDKELKEISSNTSTIPNKGFKLKEFPKSPDEMTRDDYESAYVRAMLGNPSKETMSDVDVLGVVNKMRSLDGKRGWIIDASLDELRSDQKKYRQVEVAASDRQIAVAAAGKRAVLRENQDATELYERIRAKSLEDTNKIFADGYKRWAAMHADVPIQAINILSEPVRGIGNTIGVEVPRVPTISRNVRSEVFDKIDPNNDAPRMAASVFLMAKAPAALETKAGQVYAGVDSVYNVGAGTYGGLTGKNIAEKDANGEYTAMGQGEAALRVMGGVLGGYGLRSEAKNTFNKMREGAEKLVPTGQAVVTTNGEMFPILRPSGNTIKPNPMPGLPGPTASSPIISDGINEILTGKNRIRPTETPISNGRFEARSIEEVSKAQKVNEVTSVAPENEIAYKGWYDRSEFREMLMKAKAANTDKHIKATSVSEAITRSGTGKDPAAQYLPGLNNKGIEREAIWEAYRNEHVFRDIKTNKGAFYFFKRFDDVIGYNNGKPTRWIRVEVTNSKTAPVYHGFPANINQVRKYIRKAEE